MLKEYIKPELEVIELDIEDEITTGDMDGDMSESGTLPPGWT